MPQYGGEQPQWGQQQPPPGYAYAPATTTSTNAVLALVLAIAAFFVCPVVPAIVALVFVPKARAEIAAGNGRVGGDGIVTAAKIIAWVHLGFAALLLLIFLLVIGVGAASATSLG
jgi:hypothetical protein